MDSDEEINVSAYFEVELFNNDGKKFGAGTTSVNVKRVENNEDGSITVVLDYWPVSRENIMRGFKAGDVISDDLIVVNKHDYNRLRFLTTYSIGVSVAGLDRITLSAPSRDIFDAICTPVGYAAFCEYNRITKEMEQNLANGEIVNNPPVTKMTAKQIDGDLD